MVLKQELNFVDMSIFLIYYEEAHYHLIANRDLVMVHPQSWTVVSNRHQYVPGQYYSGSMPTAISRPLPSLR